MHTDQVGMNLWGHYDDQKVVSREKKIEADYCFWQIQNKFLYMNIKLQDLTLTFDKLENVDIYVVSYFREDKDCNTFFPDEIKEGMTIDLEMYNTTVIYMRPSNRDNNRLEFSFNVFEADNFSYGMKYNLITQLISGVGGLILILSVVLYLDGFKEIWKHIKEQREEMRRQKEEQERL